MTIIKRPSLGTAITMLLRTPATFMLLNTTTIGKTLGAELLPFALVQGKSSWLLFEALS